MSTTRASLRSQVVSRSLGRAMALSSRGSRRVTADTTLEEMAEHLVGLRARIEALAARGRVPADVRIEQVAAGVDGAPVAGEWVRPRRFARSRRVVLHLHGGAYVLCSPVTHRHMVRAITRVSQAVGFVPDYRLAPEHRFPAAVEDAVAAYRWLVEDRGVDPSMMAVTGDSAGGGLGVSLLLSLRDLDLPMPACYVGLSPWTDLTGGSPSVIENNGRDVLFGAVPPPLAGRLGELYADDTSDPLASPVLADLSGLPPMLVHVGAFELIRDDGIRLVERARAHGVDASVGVFASQSHVFQVFPIPEARRSFREIGGFIRRHTPGA